MVKVGVTPKQLTTFRSQVAQLLPDLGTIWGPTYTPDGRGGGSLSYSPIGTEACRVDPAMGKKQIEATAGREAMEVTYYITLPWNSIIASDRQVRHNGFTYEVRELVDDHTNNVSRRIYAARID